MEVDIRHWHGVPIRTRPITEGGGCWPVFDEAPKPRFKFASLFIAGKEYSDVLLIAFVEGYANLPELNLTEIVALLYAYGIDFKFHDDERIEEFDEFYKQV